MREKYKPLERYLSSLAGRTSSLTFTQCVGVIGDKLPPSAFLYRHWWANDVRHVHAIAWLTSGWQVQSVNLALQGVVFVRNAQD
jgi:hypothetical protein